MLRPWAVTSHSARCPITSPTKIVPAPATSASKGGGITVVDPATPPVRTLNAAVSTRRRLSIRLADDERDAGAGGAPIDVERGAGRRVLDRDRAVLGGRARLAAGHVRAAGGFARWVRDAPLTGLLADNEVPGAAGRDRVDRVGAGGHVQAA